MDNIGLCFCIPTYNRVQSVYRLVTDILACRDASIQVVVLDNGSTDNTLSVLQGINDSRLFVYTNGENKGALYNMVHVLNKGMGEYLVYSTDQDYVDSNKITEFKAFLLQQPDLACGFCTFDSVSTVEYELFPAGYRAIKNIAYKGRHPTGYFFNNKLLKSINITERFSDYDVVDLFPLEFVFAELCLKGNGAIYHRPIFTPETGVSVVNHKSSTTDGKSKKAFFSPEARLKLAVNYTKHLNTLPLGLLKKDLLINDIFFNGFDAATIGYKSTLGNKNLCIHYYMESRNIKINELFSIGFNFYKQFISSIIDVFGVNRTRLFVFNLFIFIRFFIKMMQRLVKLATKKCNYNIIKQSIV